MFNYRFQWDVEGRATHETWVKKKQWFLVLWWMRHQVDNDETLIVQDFACNNIKASNDWDANYEII